MSDIIQLLPDAIANQIAAGEVVQRPASVVKELLENSIDAGANEIKLLVKQSGKALIQVIDNGCGMSETDARMCFERHATSKIREAKDLFSIRTMGFRGEALPSIAAVASVEMKTRKANDELANKIVVTGSKVEEQSYCEAPTGTSIAIKNLFYNTPGRRKFLKSDTVELKHIREEFIRVALANPAIDMKLYQDDRLTYHLQSGKLRQRVLSLFGEDVNKKIIPVDEETESLKIMGYIGKPEFSKKSRRDQYLFVNKRFVKNHYIAHAIKTAYAGLLDEQKNPFFVLFLDMDPGTIDINVHPTKHEIKFENEKLNYQIVNVTIKHALGKHNVTPSIDFDSENRFLINNSSQGSQARAQFANNSGRTTSYSGSNDFKQHRKNETDNIAKWQNLYQVLNTGSKSIKSSNPESNDHLESGFPDVNDLPTIKRVSAEEGDQEQIPFQKTQSVTCLQIHQSYILAQINSGLVVIDQQAAHERILFEKIKKLRQNDEISSQRLLFPVLLELSKEESLILAEMVDDINMLGFDINPFGTDSFVVHAEPAYSGISLDIEQTILDFIKQKMDEKDLNMNIQDGLIKRISIHSAIKKGHVLQVEEMSDLIDQLFACEQANYGLRENKTYRTFDHNDIANWF